MTKKYLPFARFFLLSQIALGPAKHAENTKKGFSGLFVHFVGNEFECVQVESCYPQLPWHDAKLYFSARHFSVIAFVQAAAVRSVARVTSLPNSRSHNTELATAAQRSQSSRLKLTVENVCCRNGV